MSVGRTYLAPLSVPAAKGRTDLPAILLPADASPAWLNHYSSGTEVAPQPGTPQVGFGSPPKDTSSMRPGMRISDAAVLEWIDSL